MTEMYSLSILEERSPILGRQYVHVLTEVCRGEFVLASSSFERLPAVPDRWPHGSRLCLCRHKAFSSVCVSAPPLEGHLSLDVGPFRQFRFISHLKILNLVTSAKNLFPHIIYSFQELGPDIFE